MPRSLAEETSVAYRVASVPCVSSVRLLGEHVESLTFRRSTGTSQWRPDQASLGCFAGETEGDDINFRLPDLKDPVLQAIHTRFSARVSSARSPTMMVSLLWRGGLKMGGGYPQDPDNGYLKLDKPANAPVMWANGETPFRFQRWYGGKLPIGGEEDFKVFIGRPSERKLLPGIPGALRAGTAALDRDGHQGTELVCRDLVQMTPAEAPCGSHPFATGREIKFSTCC